MFWKRLALSWILILLAASSAAGLDFTVANFSNTGLTLSEMRNGQDERPVRIEAGHPFSRKSTAGASWRVRRADNGGEICRFVTHDVMTVVSVDAPRPPAQWSEEMLAGFRVMFSARLRGNDASFHLARRFIQDRLAEIASLVPSAALKQLRDTRLWLDADPSAGGGAFFATWPSNRHGGRDRGYDGFHGAMYQGVVFPNVLESIRKVFGSQPMLVLHELAHGYHHWVLGTWNAEVRRIYNSAKERGLYRNVRFASGSGASIGHAIMNEWEYFAELTEAYFGQNDQTPLNLSDLRVYDPDGMRLLEQAWQGKLGSVGPIKSISCGSFR
jgi:hypothetical protein